MAKSRGENTEKCAIKYNSIYLKFIPQTPPNQPTDWEKRVRNARKSRGRNANNRTVKQSNSN